MNYEDVLADLRARRAQLDAAIAAVEAILGAVPSEPGDVNDSAPRTGLGRSAEIRDDSFFGMSVGDAAKKYLGMMKRPQSLADIARALNSGGLTHASTNFISTLHTALSRRAKAGEVVRVKRGQWGLSEWYPGMKKQRQDSGNVNGDAENPQD